ncbi:sulfatase-like hydrolase/transferase [Algisphaera agarilytica]|uniref:Arylsulfatase A-like enzyme n=1 Tax=Algisphaera agarilytica TaxID=1385975 RepID=A0A7X0H5U4_9BACT|nr:sulfatase-like hydrolase/transferase [Algisphaera agarilytica]MBB6429837.1 arylsulfatase A-like enzyme [Algisphaera agarilytica]
MKPPRHLIATLTAAAIILAALGPAVAADQPNIILIYTDDISARELPIYGSSEWTDPLSNNTSDPQYRGKTPVLDRLANEGVWIADAWAATICSPSRAMMMTGRYASLHKWWHNGAIGRVALDDKGTRTRPSRLYETSPLLIGHVAQQAGYATQWVGKTQMPGCDEDAHQHFGFDEGVFTPGNSMFAPNPHTDFRVDYTKVDGKRATVNVDTGQVIKSYGQTSWYWKPGVALMNHPANSKPMEYWPNTPESQATFGLNTYGPDVELDFIFEFMDRKHSDGQPFFIYHTTHLGHGAFNWIDPSAKSKYVKTPKIHWDGNAYHRDAPNITGDDGVYDDHGTLSEMGMHAHVEYLDYQVWLYLNKLKDMGIENDTVLIFCSDNGTWGYGKGSHDRQKGTHVPLIIHAPGLNFTKQGKQNVLASMADMLPTLADLVGTEIPVDYEIHGQSLIPFLTTNKPTHREWVYAYKKDMQLIRGTHVLKDGNDKWWDVSETPDDLISYPEITDWSQVSDAHRAQRDLFVNGILPRYDTYNTEPDPPTPILD